MATLALSVVGQVVGNMIAPGIGGMIGRGVGALAGAFIDQALISANSPEPTAKAPTVSDISVTSAAEGVDVPRLYGAMKVPGNVIWATYHEVEVEEQGSGGSKGLSQPSTGTKTYKYYANFAVGLCEGEITRLGRVWADGEEISLVDYTYRLYTGTETQTPDSLIEAKEGTGNAPAYRGLAYIVFERMPLNDYGKRVPRFEFEVYRAVDVFEGLIQGVTMIPAATEFGYHPTEVRCDWGDGVTVSENRHVNTAVSDWAAALDQLEETLPNCGAVSLFSAWFGSDLRCGNCTIKPKVDTHEKGNGTTPISWGAAGLTRATADVISSHDGAVAYGGSPSDNTVIAAIADLKTRGLDVIFTPFILMDVPSDNTLPDPYTGATGQPAYPWRGRITCSPAPGISGTPDKTAAAQTQVDAFYGTVTAADFSVAGGVVTYTGPVEWTYSRFVLHCAALCAAAGGVDAFVIGSEMRGLTWVRDSASTYPFVDYLRTLAAQVAILLPAAKLTYAADWSEYFGHQPADGSGDVYFHLDPLWSDSNIDAVAIDNYWPLADWRDGSGHLDWIAGARDSHDLDYLKGNIAGGEGYTWYYASENDRQSQARTTITDGAGKPWVFRFKDIRSWWTNAHYNRPGGVEDGSPTAWTPQGKPVWFTELGCPAADKGANQPNVFYDPKSSESAVPYFSRGTRDDLMQRRYCRAMLEWYAVAANNPTSTVYSAPMVDTSRIMIYTWDARPYPAFPAWRSIWADGTNWQLGHWLSGRVAGAPLPETVAKILEDHEFTDYDVSGLSGSMAGYVIDRVCSARDAIQPLETAFFFDSFESQGNVCFAQRGLGGSLATLTDDDLVETSEGAALFDLRRAQETDLPRAATVTYYDSGNGYKTRTTQGRRIAGASGRVASARLPIATSYDAARTLAETLVQEPWAARERATFALPPSRLALDATDMVTLSDGARAWPLRLTALSVGAGGIEAEASTVDAQLYQPFASPTRAETVAAPIIYGVPAAAFLDLPLIRGDEVPYAGALAAFASPWPGSVAFYRSPGTSGYTLKATAATPATMGTTQTAFYSGPTGRWDRGNVLRVTLSSGQLSSAAELLVLGGSNVAVVQNSDGEWEVIQFATATLVSALTYDLSGLLRGCYGTELAMRDSVAAGAAFVLLNTALVQPDALASERGLPFNWKYGPASQDIGASTFATVLGYTFSGVGLRPLSPCHVTGSFNGGGDLVLAWKRRTRTGGDSWEQTEVPLGEDSEAYEVDVMDGATVKRTLTATSATATYAAAQQTADFGAPQSSYTVRVYQLSASFGRGARREAVVP